VGDRTGSQGPGSWPGTTLSRQALLRRAGFGAAAIGLAPVVAACGGSGSESTATSQAQATQASSAAAVATSAAAATKGGTLRVGVAGGGSSDSVDAHRFINIADWMRLAQLYDALTWYTPEFGVDMALAEVFEPGSSATEWTIRLKDGIEFHNGKTLDADDLIFTFQRALDPDFANTAGSTLFFVDPQGLTKLDNRTVRLTLNQPIGNLARAMSPLHALIVPVGFDPQKPVGTGPFKLVSFTPGGTSTFARFDNYWGGPAALDEVHIIGFADDAARVNALLSKQADAINAVPYNQVSALEGASGVKVMVSDGAAWSPFTMNTKVAPFNDIRVRQAMRLIANRQQIVDQALGGHGTVGNDLYCPYDPAYLKDIPQREQDIEQAKSLLKAAGQENLKVTLTTGQVANGVNEAAQALAEQAKAAGVTIDVNKVDPGTFYGKTYPEHVFGVDWWGSRYYVPQVFLCDYPKAAYNTSHWQNPEFMDLFKRGAGELDDAKARDLLQQAQQIQHDESGYLIWGFRATVDAYAENVTGLQENVVGLGLNNGHFNTVGYA
jgi:peptide/nickel transport system substrate-binding protein